MWTWRQILSPKTNLPLLDKPRKLKFNMQPYFNPTRRNMQKTTDLIGLRPTKTALIGLKAEIKYTSLVKLILRIFGGKIKTIVPSPCIVRIA